MWLDIYLHPSPEFTKIKNFTFFKCTIVLQRDFDVLKLLVVLLILYASFHKCSIVTQECCLESKQSVSLCMRLQGTKHSVVYGDSLTQDPDREHRLWSYYNFHSFIHSFGMCIMRRFLVILRNFFHSSLLYNLSFHPFPSASLPSSLTSSCNLFLGLPPSLIASKFIYNTFFGILFSSILCTYPNQRNIFHLIFSVRVGFLTTA